MDSSDLKYLKQYFEKVINGVEKLDKEVADLKRRLDNLKVQ